MDRPGNCRFDRASARASSAVVRSLVRRSGLEITHQDLDRVLGPYGLEIMHQDLDRVLGPYDTSEFALVLALPFPLMRRYNARRQPFVHDLPDNFVFNNVPSRVGSRLSPMSKLHPSWLFHRLHKIIEVIFACLQHDGEFAIAYGDKHRLRSPRNLDGRTLIVRTRGYQVEDQTLAQLAQFAQVGPDTASPRPCFDAACDHHLLTV